MDDFSAGAAPDLEALRRELAETRAELAAARREQEATAEVLRLVGRSAYDLGAVFETLIASAVRLVGMDAGLICVRDGEHFRFRAGHGLDPRLVEFLKSRPVAPSRGSTTARILLTRDVVRIENTALDPDYVQPVNPIGPVHRAHLGVPLMRGESLEGALALVAAEPRSFSPREVELLRTFADQAVIAIENSRLLDEVRARTHDLEEALAQQTATSEVLQAISRTAFDLEKVLETLASTAARLCNANGGQIFRRDGDSYVFWAGSFNVWIDGKSIDATYLEHERAARIRPGRGTVVGRAAAERRTVMIEDAWNDPDYEEKNEARRGHVRALLGIPLLRNGEPVGVFALGRPDPVAFTPRECELVQTFADQAVIAIENARLFVEVQSKTHDLEESLAQQTATADVLKVISRSAFDLEVVLTTLAQSALEQCHGRAAYVVLREGDDLKFKAMVGHTSDAFLDVIRSARLRVRSDTLTGRPIATGEVVHVPDARNDTQLTWGRERELSEFGSGLGVPLILDGERIGAFVIGHAEPHAFTPKRVELVTMFADQAVIAIKNVRLFDQVRAKTRDLEEALAQQTATADVLKTISRSAFDLGAVLTAVIGAAIRLTDAARGVVWLAGEGGLRVAAHVQYPPEWVEEASRLLLVPAPDSPTVTGRAAFSGEVVNVEDMTTDPRFAGLAVHGLGDYRSAIAVPLKRDGRVLGVISLSRPEARLFSERQAALVTGFADQAVIAMENARLFNEVQSKTKDLEEALAQQTATADVLKTISRSVFDLDAVLQTLIDTAVRLARGSRGTIFMRDGDVMRARAFHSQVPASLKDYLIANPIPLSDSEPIAQAVRTGQLVHVPDMAVYDTERVRQTRLRAGFGAALWAPLMRDGEAIGLFGVPREQAIPFGEREIELVRTFADQAVIAIENARLFEEVQTRTREIEEALAQQTATAEVLKVISRSAFDLRTVFETLLKTALELVGGVGGAIALREGDRLRFRAGASPRDDLALDFVGREIAIDRNSAAGRATLSGRTEYIPDAEADPDFRAVSSQTWGRSYLGVPLIRDGVTEGALTIIAERRHAFTARHVELVETFADQAVIAIGNTRLFEEVQARTRELEQSLSDLRKAQDRLVQSEKLASLGQLTAGIAHEIKNPLNFVNNFASLSRELLDELRETLGKLPEDARADADEVMGLIASNLEKVASHGKRADSIIKNMLLHSREGSGERTNVNINAMVEEALNLGYHGARAEKPGFNVTLERDFDPRAGEAEIHMQEVARVLLNLISNGFYASSKRKLTEGADFAPTLKASTRDLGHSVEIRIRDNGTGIPDAVRAKMFNPFFTTKPAGEGTGLGLSLSHDIVVKQHGGTLEVETEAGAFAEFVVTLPRKAPSA